MHGAQTLALEYVGTTLSYVFEPGRQLVSGVHTLSDVVVGARLS
jgi:hypothetical protein